MNSVNGIDLDISNYSIEELKTIFGVGSGSGSGPSSLDNIDLDFTEEDVNDAMIRLLKDYSILGEQNYIRFLKQARKKLLYYLMLKEQTQTTEHEDGVNDDDEKEDDGDENDDDENENDGENEDDGENEVDRENEVDGEKQEDNITNEKLKEINSTTEYISGYLDDVYKTNHIPNRKYANQILNDENNKNILYENRLPIQQQYTISVARGQLNPNLKNTNTQIINIDSSFRQDIINTNANDFVVDLSEPLHKVISISLFNFEIPHCWYTFDSNYGTNYFFCDSSMIIIPSGNYSQQELIDEINNQLLISYGEGVTVDISFVYNSINNKVMITNHSEDSSHNLYFYNVSQAQEEYNERLVAAGINQGKINNNLGWLLGCRSYDTDGNLAIFLDVSGGGGGGGGGSSGENTNEVTFSSNIDIYGPKYIYLMIDDFNNNYNTKNIINIADAANKLDLPNYFSYDLSLSNPIYFNNGKLSGLTRSQAHSIVEILAQREKKNYQNRDFGIASSDIFARIPIQIKNKFETFVYTNNTLRSFVRTYFGPVDISRLRISLYNDKGQLLNLNGRDYSFTLVVEELYQY
jgi:hypothetical protein